MKETWIHGGKCGTMRVITAALRNGGAAVASGGPGRAGSSFLSVFLLISSLSRVNKNNALGPLPDQMPAHEDRYAPLLLRPEYGYRLSAKKERSSSGEAICLPFGISRCRIIDATRYSCKGEKTK